MSFPAPIKIATNAMNVVLVLMKTMVDMMKMESTRLASTAQRDAIDCIVMDLVDRVMVVVMVADGLGDDGGSHGSSPTRFFSNDKV